MPTGSLLIDGEEGVLVRSIGLDVDREFCEVTIVEAGEVRSAGRIETTPATLELFGASGGRGGGGNDAIQPGGPPARVLPRERKARPT